MNRALRETAQRIVQRAIEAVMPDAAVRRALEGADFPGRVILVAVGKAAWQMARSAYDCLGEKIHDGQEDLRAPLGGVSSHVRRSFQGSL